VVLIGRSLIIGEHSIGKIEQMTSNKKIFLSIEKILEAANNQRIKFDAPNETIIKKYGDFFNINFSEELQIFFKEASTIFYGIYSPLLLSDDPSKNEGFSNALCYMKKMNAPKDWIPFCENNGDYFCIDAVDKVHYWSNSGASEEVWDSLSDWIENVWLCSP
jgi:predicted component of viral defense system (DUF524 family)